MLQPKQILRFAVLAIAFYLVTMWLRPYVEDPYARYFRGLCNAVFAGGWLHADARACFLDLETPDLVGEVEAATGLPLRGRYAPPEPTPHKDTLMLLIHRHVPVPFGQMKTSSRLVGYEPTAVILALLLATSYPTWTRRWVALGIGLILVHGFILLRLSFNLLVGGFAAGRPYSVFHPSEFWFGVLDRGDDILMQDPTASWTFPVFVWFVVVLLTGSLRAFRSGVETADTPEA
jgi:hypothetical protein